MKVFKYFGLRKKAGDLGIEIEVEGNRLPTINSNASSKFVKYWEVTSDGSLRGNSFEYVLNGPLKPVMATRALKALDEEYTKCRSVINDSVRTGVHVHVNCQDLTMKEMMTFATCYYALEGLLIEFCEESRRGNHFCLRASDAEYVLYLLHHSLTTSNNLRALSTNNIRYASMNFLSLFKFGSLEFRALEGTKDLGKIDIWANMLLTLRENSKKFDSPKSVVEGMSDQGGEEFAKALLGDFYKFFKDMDVEEHVYSGVRNIQTIAYTVDWDTFFSSGNTSATLDMQPPASESRYASLSRDMLRAASSMEEASRTLDTPPPLQATAYVPDPSASVGDTPRPTRRRPTHVVTDESSAISNEDFTRWTNFSSTNWRATSTEEDTSDE